MSQERLERAEEALSSWIADAEPEPQIVAPTPKPTRSFLQSAFLTGATIITWLGILVITSVFLFFVFIIFKAYA